MRTGHMTTPSAIIAEDEPLILREIRDMLSDLWPQLAVVAEAGDGMEALAAVERLAPDVIFLDIQMPGLNGLEVAQRLDRKAHVVFITAFDKYAVSAFEHGALDYLLKPISASRMQATIERLRGRLSEPPADLGRIAELLKEIIPPESKYLKWLTVPVGQELRVVAVAEISYLRADQKYTTLVTPYGSFLMNASLRQMKEKLDPQVFW
jgi:DNA-binding LytR/AlgR family response regulator